MSDRLLERYMGRRSSPDSETGGGAEADASENLGFFGWLRGPRDRAIMLELRKRTGHILAISYGYIDRIEFRPSDGILLHCGHQQITIKGRNLNGEIRPGVRLFSGLARHRVTWIAEGDPSSAVRTDKCTLLVEAFEW
jgi:hypothetical protein